ncbi:CZB domain-containing protein [Sulfurimonas sp.]|nr:CZB domain-containing protein [Sulfurimonas sp.]
MEKENILNELRAAKVAHLKWVQRAKSLISGMPVEKEAIPLDYTDCVFGKWFYSVGQEIALLPGMSVMDSIGEKHTHLHDMYFKIFQIYFGDSTKSFFAKLLKMKKKVSAAEEEMAQQYYAELEKISKELVELIGRLERRINALGEEFFTKK